MSRPRWRSSSALEATGWKGQRGTALVQHDGDHRFIHEAATALAAQGAFEIATLSHGGKPVACGLVLRHQRRAYFFKIAIDETEARTSPGVQLTLDLTRQYCDDTGDRRRRFHRRRRSPDDQSRLARPAAALSPLRADAAEQLRHRSSVRHHRGPRRFPHAGAQAGPSLYEKSGRHRRELHAALRSEGLHRVVSAQDLRPEAWLRGQCAADPAAPRRARARIAARPHRIQCRLGRDQPEAGGDAARRSRSRRPS